MTYTQVISIFAWGDVGISDVAFSKSGMWTTVTFKYNRLKVDKTKNGVIFNNETKFAIGQLESSKGGPIRE